MYAGRVPIPATKTPLEFASSIAKRLGNGSIHVEAALGEIAGYFDAERAAFFRVSHETGTIRLSHEYCAPGTPSRKASLQNVSLDEFPYASSLLLEGNDLVIGDLEDLPVHADQERSYFALQGRNASFCVPVPAGGRARALLAVYGGLGQSRLWPEHASAVLRLCGQALLSALESRLSAEVNNGVSLTQVLDTAPVAVFIFEHSPEGLILRGFNAEALALTRGGAETFAGQSAGQIYPDRPDLVEKMEQALASGQKTSFETEYTSRGSRETFTQRFTFAPLSQAVLLVYAQTTSETRRLKVEAKNREQLIESILENSPAVIYMKDYLGRYLRVNRRFEQIFNLRREDVLGRTDYDLFAPEAADLFRRNDLAVLAQGKPIQYEELVPHGGREHTYISVKFPIEREGNEAYALCGISTDITSRKEIETALNAARRIAEEANSAKSMFLATISHEMRTPLNAILGMSDLLAKEIQNAGAQNRLEILNHSARNLLHLITDILDFEKIQAGKLELVERSQPLRPVLLAYEQLFPILAENNDVRFTVWIDPAIPQNLFFDTVRMEQVLGNLVSNAAKYTRSGSVSLKAELLSRKEAVSKIRFSVEDTGPGIPSEYIPRLGEPFLQIAPGATEQRGTGLGLAVVNGILALLDSQLNVESAPGRGSRFSFTASFEEGNETPDSVIQEVPQAELHLLIVDDNDINLTVLGAYIERWGWTYDLARNGREAVDQFDPKKHNAVIMDILMPVMDGLEAGRIILDRFPAARIVALTADLSPDNLRRVQAAGFHGLLGKPFDPAALQTMLLESQV